MPKPPTARASASRSPSCPARIRASPNSLSASENSPVRNAASVNASSAAAHSWRAVLPDWIVMDDSVFGATRSLDSCLRVVRTGQTLPDAALAGLPSWLGYLAGDELVDGLPLILVAGALEQVAPRGYLRAPAEQRAALPLGHPAPDTELDPVVERIRKALRAHRASPAD